MKLTKKIGALLAAGTFALSGCWDFRDNTLEKSKQSELRKLPLETRYIKCADMNNNGRQDCIVAGNLVGEPDKCGVYLLENKQSHYKPKLLHDEIAITVPSISLRDVNNDGLKDIIIRSNTLSEKRRTHWKSFNLINKGDFYVLE